jgi:hypothetical protein
VPARAERLVLRSGAFARQRAIGRSDDLLVPNPRRERPGADGTGSPTFLAWELGGPR